MRSALTILLRMCISWMRSLAALIGLAAVSFGAAPQNSGCDATAIFVSVSSLLQSRNYEGAARALDGLDRCPDLSAIETFQMGWLYGRARRFNTALKIFHSVSEDVPDRLTHQYAIALSQFELSDYRSAADTLAVLPSGALDAKSANLLAVSYSKLGRYREAYAVLKMETQKDPHDLSAFLNLITVCAESGSFEQAAKIASEATRLFPRSAEVFVVEGAANILLGHLDEAYGDFSTAVHLDPARPDTRFFLALTDYKQGKFSDAVAVLKAANNQGLVDSDLHYLLAECLLKANANDTISAMSELDRAIELDGDSVSARTLRGRLLLEAGHPKEAVADLEIASHRDPESRSANYNLARAYRTLGKTDQARLLFQRLRGQTADTLTALSDQKLNNALAGKGAQP
jgi:tetratricopeptide (TPR) repeat protein